MIITVTMNPAIDKTIYLDKLHHGGLNRIKNVKIDAGGKGINVSKTIKKLGGFSTAVGFAGGNAGRTILQILDQEYIAHKFVWILQETRTNTKIYEKGGITTELNDPGPVIEQEQIDRLLEKLSFYADEHNLFVLSGSVSAGVSSDFYAEIIQYAHEHGIQVLLDADGELLKNGIEAGPDMIKPNKGELIRYAGLSEDATMEELIAAGRDIQKKGVHTVAITMGAEGAVLLKGESCLYAPALQVKAESTVGAGDAFVAGLAFAWEKEMNEEDTMRLCMAAAAGAVTTAGTNAAATETVEELMKEVNVRRLDS